MEFAQAIEGHRRRTTLDRMVQGAKGSASASNVACISAPQSDMSGSSMMMIRGLAVSFGAGAAARMWKGDAAS